MSTDLTWPHSVRLLHGRTQEREWALCCWWGALASGATQGVLDMFLRLQLGKKQAPKGKPLSSVTAPRLRHRCGFPPCTHPETALEQSPTHWTLGHRCLPGGAAGSLGLRRPGTAGGGTAGLRAAACEAAVTSIVCEEILLFLGSILLLHVLSTSVNGSLTSM